MAASVATTATTLEAQLLQTATRVQIAERAYNVANPDTPVNNVTIATDAEAGTVTITATLPATFSDSAGALQATVDAYLP